MKQRRRSTAVNVIYGTFRGVRENPDLKQHPDTAKTKRRLPKLVTGVPRFCIERACLHLAVLVPTLRQKALELRDTRLLLRNPCLSFSNPCFPLCDPRLLLRDACVLLRRQARVRRRVGGRSLGYEARSCQLAATT